MYNVTVIGGTGAFGSWIVNFLYSRYSLYINLSITGSKTEKYEQLKQKVKFKYFEDNYEAIKNADIVIFAASIQENIELIKELGPHIKSGGAVIDVTSVKKQPAYAMRDYVGDDVLKIPMHPMFGPYVNKLDGQILVFTPLDEQTKKDKRYQFFKNAFEKEDAQIIEVTPQEHDKVMAVVQGITHYSLFTMAETIRRLDTDIDFSYKLASPIYKILVSMVSRYVGHNPGLYADIQMFNDEIKKMHKVFLDTASNFSYIFNKGEKKKFIETINECKTYFGDETKEGQKYTDKVVFLLSKQIEKANDNIGKNIVLENIYTGETKKGKLSNFFENRYLLVDEEKYDINEWYLI